MKRRHKTSIRRRLFQLLMTVGILLVAVCVGAYSLFAYREAISARESYNTQTASSLAIQMDQLTERMDIIACQVLSSNQLQELMHAAVRNPDAGNYFDRSLEARRNAQRILWLFNSPIRVVQAINIFEGRSFVGLLNAPPQARIDQISALDCWKVPNRGSYLIAPHADDWRQITDQQVLSLVRAFSDTSSSFDRIGTIEIQVTTDAIKEALQVEDEYMQSYILDGDGVILYPESMQGIRVELPGDTEKLISFADANGVRSIGAMAKMEKYDWTVLFFQDEAVYRAAMLRSIIIPMGIGVLLILMAVTAFTLIARSFTQPIRSLTDAVGKVTLENADALRDLEDSTEEIDTLRDAFLERSVRLQETATQLVSASESELRLKLSALQAHINPHFLYNSLMAISAAGQEGNAARVEDMCYQLAELYRYTDAEKPNLITMEQEIENARIYLEFMKYRYEDNLSFEIETAGDLDNVRIPRLVLQPLIENCFSHGFLSVAPPFKMRLFCKADADGWVVEVGDNGVGFTPEIQQSLYRRFHEIDAVFASHVGYQTLSMDGMAIVNVYIRLCSMYPGRVEAVLGRDDVLGGAKVCIIAHAEEVNDHDPNTAA